MWKSVIVVAISLSLVVAQEDAEQQKPVYKPPPRPTGDVYLAESFSDPESVWERSVSNCLFSVFEFTPCDG